MEELICPVCGEPNPPESETCSNCGSSLHAPIQPGDAPTQRSTSELEPLLPEWLREAREKARDADAREITQPLKKVGGPSGGPSDLLAGLNAQSKEDDAEVPDWLANITGAKGPKKPSEATGPRRVELNDFTAAGAGEEEEETPAPPASETPSDPLAWLSDLSEPGTQQPPEDDLQDWFKQTVAPMPPAQETPPAASSDAELMDWLDNLKSESAAPAASETSESSLPAWLSGAEEETPPAAPAEAGGTPAWLKDLQSRADSPESGAAPSFSDWSRGAEVVPPAEEEKPEPAITPADLPDWLNELRAASEITEEPAEEPSSETPSAPVEPGNFAWLREMQESAAPPEPEKPTPAFEDSGLSSLEGSPLEGSGNLDWLKDMQAESSEIPEQLSTPALSEEPDWFTQASTEATPTEAPPPASPLDVELPDWLRDATPESLAAPEESAELPDWMKAVSGEPAATPAEGEMPDWLSAPAAATPAAEEPATPEASIPNMPGWLTGMTPVEQPPAEQPPFADEGELPLPALPGATLPSGGLDSLFTAMPDWLSEAAEAAPAASGEPAAAPTPVSSAIPEIPAESLTPANLPSWVQAMRPVEAVPSGPQGGDDTLETQGPLAGLRGVLPALPYIGPANRPQAQSLKLNASNEQQNHGALLEQVLQSEVHPVPITAAPRIHVQRGLHLVTGLLLFAALLGAVLMGTRILPLPVGWPAETVSAVQAVESIPAGAPVLVVFDYEPSLAGEMEAAAAPLLDHLIIRSHPVLTLISTSPTGTALAERLFSGPLAGLAYQDRVNLGYLPGGLGGVRSFVQNAAAAMPLGADSTPVTAGVRPYSEYAGILVITDSVDGGRTWIEQAGPPNYNGTAFVVVSSAQAGPMLQPYYHSGQINGLVSGLFDAAVLEQNNAGRPGLARAYWDTFNLGLILSVALITVGALWSLISALRERNSAEAG